MREEQAARRVTRLDPFGLGEFLKENVRIVEKVVDSELAEVLPRVVQIPVGFLSRDELNDLIVGIAWVSSEECFLCDASVLVTSAQGKSYEPTPDPPPVRLLRRYPPSLKT